MFPSGDWDPGKKEPQELAAFITAQPRASYPEGRCWNKSVYNKGPTAGRRVSSVFRLAGPRQLVLGTEPETQARATAWSVVPVVTD